MRVMYEKGDKVIFIGEDDWVEKGTYVVEEYENAKEGIIVIKPTFPSKHKTITCLEDEIMYIYE